MALKQRTWAILIRPYTINAKEYEYYMEMPYRPAKQGSGYDKLTGDFDGVVDNWEKDNASTVTSEGGAWVVWYITTSYEEFRTAMEKALRYHPKNSVRGIEYVSTGTIITPFA